MTVKPEMLGTGVDMESRVEWTVLLTQNFTAATDPCHREPTRYETSVLHIINITMPAYVVNSGLKQAISDDCFDLLWTTVDEDKVSTVKEARRVLEKTGQWQLGCQAQW